MVSDPFYVPYGSLNLNPSLWEELQRDQRVFDLANKVKEIINQDLVAKVPKRLLNELGFDAAVEAELSHIHMQHTNHAHWAGLAICIISHASMQSYDEFSYEYRTNQIPIEETQAVRFIKSPYDNLPYLPKNIKWIEDKTCRWGKNVLKSKPPETIIEPPQQFSLF